MLIKLIIFVIISWTAAVVQSSSSITLPTNSSDPKSQEKNDLSIIESLKLVAHLSCQKFVYSLFNAMNEIVKAKDDRRHQNDTSSTDSDVRMNDLRMQLLATLLAIENIKPESYSEISSARKSLISMLEVRNNRFNEALELARLGNDSANLEKIDDIANTASENSPYTKQMFCLLGMGVNTPPKIGEAIDRAINKSDTYYLSIRRGIFAAIYTVAIRNDLPKTKVITMLKNYKSQVSEAYREEVEARFDFLYRIDVALLIIRYKIDIDDYDNNLDTTNSQSHVTNQECSTENENEGISDCSLIQNYRQKSLSLAREGTELIFRRLRTMKDNINYGVNNCDEFCLCKSEVEKIKEFASYRAEIGAVLDANLIAQPEASALTADLESALECSLLERGNNIQSAIELINQNCSKDIETKVREFEETAISEAISVTQFMYMAILNDRDSSSETEASILREEKISITYISKVFKNIFKAIKLLLAKACPNLNFGNPGCSTSLKSCENAANSAFEKKIASQFNAIYGIIDPDENCSGNSAARRL